MAAGSYCYAPATMSKLPLLIDKNFLQGSKAIEIQRLMETHELLMPDVLFYELITSSEPGRSRSFAKLPNVDNPVALCKHLGGLLKHEIEHHRPCGKPSDNLEDLRFRFNEALANPGYQLPPYALEAVHEEDEQLRSDVSALLQLVESVPDIFPDLLKGSDAQREQERTEVEAAIANDTKGILEFYASLASAQDAPPLPPPYAIDENWALFRWVQVRLLFVVDIYCRYGGKVPQDPAGRIYEKLEHDLHDAHYLILGVLEGALATREKKLQRWFALLRPEGRLYS